MSKPKPNDLTGTQILALLKTYDKYGGETDYQIKKKIGGSKPAVVSQLKKELELLQKQMETFNPYDSYPKDKKDKKDESPVKASPAKNVVKKRSTKTSVAKPKKVVKKSTKNTKNDEPKKTKAVPSAKTKTPVKAQKIFVLTYEIRDHHGNGYPSGILSAPTIGKLKIAVKNYIIAHRDDDDYIEDDDFSEDAVMYTLNKIDEAYKKYDRKEKRSISISPELNSLYTGILFVNVPYQA